MNARKEERDTFSIREAFTPVLCTLGQVDAQPVGSRERRDVLQVGRLEHSDDTVSTAAEDQVVSDHQATRRRRLRSIKFNFTKK